MKFRVVALRRADNDVRKIVRWIAARSPQGANSWLDAYDELLNELASEADRCAPAIENHEFELPIKQALFHTRQGGVYRAVFTIVGDEVRLLRIRGPGQPPLTNNELI